MAETIEVGNNPQSHLQHVPPTYNIGCWRGCCLCFRLHPELGKCRNSYCFLNFMLWSVLCVYNVSSLQTGMLLVLRRLYLLVHKLGDGLLCPDALPLSCFSLLPLFPDSFSTVQTCTEHQSPLCGPCRQAGTVGACCRVLDRGACTAECHLCVPGW